MAHLTRQVFSIRDLSTKSVTLYPSRAQIVREIRDIELEPGLNEVEIIGLTPSTDEHSVQIDGRRAATITDLTVELVPNQESYDDVFPDDDDDLDDDVMGPDYEDSDDEVEAIKVIANEMRDLEIQKKEAENREGSAVRQLEALDLYTKSAQAKGTDAADMAKILELYTQKRKEVYQSHSTAKEEVRKLAKQIARMEHEKSVAGKDERRQKEKAKKQKLKERARQSRKLMERRNEKARQKAERMKYWPKQVYRVLLRLETASTDTPASSRRNSMDGVTLSGTAPVDKLDTETSTSENRTVTLALSYVTSEAFWMPRYDISISSVRKTATITYRAEFGNRTSETWTDTKLVLSTSQTSYSGLDDKPPTMQPWNVKLSKYDNAGGAGLLSFAETKRSDYVHKSKGKKMNRSQLFGYPEYANNSSGLFGNQNQVLRSQATGCAPVATGSTQRGGGLFGAPQAANTASSSLFAAAPPPPPGQQQQAVLQQSEEQYSNNATWTQQQQMMQMMQAAPEIDGLRDVDEDQLDFEESTWEDNGLTATYEVPGTRTIIPASLNRRHKIASLSAANIQMSYISIPKLRSAAFLRAKVRNPSSSITLLKGMAGVTLDGSFLGNISLPRVSPSQPFTLSLGTDPAIHVSYPKPSVHRSTQGIFNKERAQTFSRSVWLTNTRSTPVELLVLDQIPQSQDEKLKIDVLQPKGLHKEGDEVRAGQSAKEGGSGAMQGQRGESWGKAVASLKKNGEVAWNVNLEKGQACLLKLEYEARMPSQDNIVNA